MPPPVFCVSFVELETRDGTFFVRYLGIGGIAPGCGCRVITARRLACVCVGYFAQSMKRDLLGPRLRGDDGVGRRVMYARGARVRVGVWCLVDFSAALEMTSLVAVRVLVCGRSWS